MAATKQNRSFIRLMIYYGLGLGAVAITLKLLEFNLVIRNNTFEIYAFIIALVFCAVGIWLGIKLMGHKTQHIIIREPVPGKETAGLVDENKIKELGLSRREYEVLELMALGHTNQEIADKLFVSPNTIKTHLANIFAKLDVGRRTQAVQRAKELNILS